MKRRSFWCPQIRVWQVSTVLRLSAGGLLESVLLIPFFGVPAPYNNGLLAPIFAGFAWALSVIPTPLSRWLYGKVKMASGPGKCQLCAVPDPSANPFRVSSLSMGDPCVLSGVPGALFGVESVELPLFRDAGSPLVAGAVPYALGAKYSRGAFHSKARPNLQSLRQQGIRRSMTGLLFRHPGFHRLK
jgi:hypothetical protein